MPQCVPPGVLRPHAHKRRATRPGAPPLPGIYKTAHAPNKHRRPIFKCTTSAGWTSPLESRWVGRVAPLESRGKCADCDSVHVRTTRLCGSMAREKLYRIVPPTSTDPLCGAVDGSHSISSPICIRQEGCVGWEIASRLPQFICFYSRSAHRGLVPQL